MDIFQFFTPKINTFYLNSDISVYQAIETFDTYKFSVVPLVDKDGKYVTTVSEGDLLRYIKSKAGFSMENAKNTLVSEIDKYRPYKALDLGAKIETILLLSLDQNFIPIIDDRGIYIGILKRRSLIEYLYRTNSNYVFETQKTKRKTKSSKQTAADSEQTELSSVEGEPDYNDCYEQVEKFAKENDDKQ